MSSSQSGSASILGIPTAASKHFLVPGFHLHSSTSPSSEMPCRSTCAIDDPTQIPEIKTHRPGHQDRADCLQRQAWDIRSPGKLSPGVCQAPNESHLCPLIGVLSRELFAPILPAAYLNSQIAQIATYGPLGRCCRRDLRRRCASEKHCLFPNSGKQPAKMAPKTKTKKQDVQTHQQKHGYSFGGP